MKRWFCLLAAGAALLTSVPSAWAGKDVEGRMTLRERIRKSLAGGQENLEGLEPITWKVGDSEREGLVYFPPAPNDAKAELPEPTPNATPLIIAFHGHGGRPQHVARKLAYHKLWPEAIVVYPQGLPTAVPVIDVQGRFSGWQKYIGDQDDRDLALFDVIVETMQKEHPFDENRLYCSGHSNGGFFTYVLCAARGDQLAAVAPIAAMVDQRDFSKQTPLPVFHVAGERDRLVRFAAQERSIEQLVQLNGCEPDGKADGPYGTLYSSESGPPVFAYRHPGGHEVPEEAPAAIIQFFQQHARQEMPAVSE